MTDAGLPRVSRRRALGLAGGAGVIGVAGCSAAPAPAKHVDSDALTTAHWRQTRGRTYLIAHRGSGDVYPEHSMAAYTAAVQWGAQCLEVSVGMTSDGVLICLHDDTYDRTTDATGRVDAQPSTILRGVRIVQPQLGPAWTNGAPVPIPLFEDVLRTFGGRVILCVEAKQDAAYGPMKALIERHKLTDSVIIKASIDSHSLPAARGAGFPVFGYLGGTELDRVDELAKMLDRSTDSLGLPAFAGNDETYIADSVVRKAVATGIPVWVYPAHRRIDVAHFHGLGVAGVMASGYGYLATDRAVATADSWRYKAIAAGELSKQPENGHFAPTWTGVDELTLAVPNTQQFMMLGQLCPISKDSYHIEFRARWTVLPALRTTNMTVAFGHADDRYYEHELGVSTGYHAILRADGRLQLYLHRAGTTTGRQLGPTITTPAPIAGKWMSFGLTVTPVTIHWERLDDPSARAISVADATVRGGYVHIGRSSADNRSVLSFRHLSVS